MSIAKRRPLRSFLLFVLLFKYALIPVLAQEKKLLRKGDFTSEIKDFKRSSLLTLMIETPEKEQLKSIKNAFKKTSISKKFNEHEVGVSFLTINGEAKDQSYTIQQRLKELNLAKKLIAKWFNRTKNGTFDVALIKERGLYNASAFDIQIAKNTLRGNAMLADAGEHLIANTFVVVNDYKYTNKEEVVSKSKNILSDISLLIGNKSSSNVVMAADAFGKGYVIKTTSYLYRLVWDEETSNTFYETFWTTKKNYDEAKVKAFNETDIFRLEYIGKQDSWSDVQSTKYTSKTDAQLIERATIKASDASLSKLERKFEVFRTKTALIGVEPLAAEIGLKEGLVKGDKFEVLEQVLLENGTIDYKKITEITVDHNQIWDNSYLPEEIPASDIDFTVFKGNSKKLYPGMLIRFKKNQNLFK